MNDLDELLYEVMARNPGNKVIIIGREEFLKDFFKTELRHYRPPTPMPDGLIGLYRGINVYQTDSQFMGEEFENFVILPMGEVRKG